MIAFLGRWLAAAPAARRPSLGASKRGSDVYEPLLLANRRRERLEIFAI
jgi:hypothetical protein